MDLREYPEAYDLEWLKLNSVPYDLILENYKKKMAFIEEVIFHDPSCMSRTVEGSKSEYDTIGNREHLCYDRNELVEVDCCGAAIPMGFRDLRNYMSEIILKRIGNVKGSFLDFGCGNCFNARYIAERCRESRITGIDISQSRIDHARQWMGHLPNLQLLQMNGARLEFADNSFDVVYSCHALEQMESVIESAICEIVRVMKHRAVLVEPVIEHADTAQKVYILKYGYVQSLMSVLARMPHIRIVEKFPLAIQGSPLNQSSVVVIEKRY